ncbi:MAG: hypothetical protein LBR52_06135 [Prevotellaceae bacterium]|nr:hypothetical protein [Prevotellaceae bacterium]
MRKVILIFVAALLLSCLGVFAQNVTDKKGKKQGEWTKKYPNGIVMYEGKFKDDKPVGLFKHYYETGKLKIEQNHLANDISEIKLYEVNGKTLAATGKYYGRIKEGEWKYYSENRLVLTENYKNGLKEGLALVYSRTGSIVEKIPYRKDKIEGMRKYYLEDGKLYSEISYVDGKEDGAYRLFEGNDTPVATGQYVMGKKEGDWNFYENGKIVETQKYQDGVCVNENELKKKHGKTFDENEKNKGKFNEPTLNLDEIDNPFRRPEPQY